MAGYRLDWATRSGAILRSTDYLFRHARIARAKAVELSREEGADCVLVSRVGQHRQTTPTMLFMEGRGVYTDSRGRPLTGGGNRA